MNLTEALDQVMVTKRSKTFIVACRARELFEKLDWLTGWHGNKPIIELVK